MGEVPAWYRNCTDWRVLYEKQDHYQGFFRGTPWYGVLLLFIYYLRKLIKISVCLSFSINSEHYCCRPCPWPKVTSGEVNYIVVNHLAKLNTHTIRMQWVIQTN